VDEVRLLYFAAESVDQEGDLREGKERNPQRRMIGVEMPLQVAIEVKLATRNWRALEGQQQPEVGGDASVPGQTPRRGGRRSALAPDPANA
jgi:hypothetical protein